MIIDAVTVAVHWHDKFEKCVGNKRFFRHWVVVVSEDDQDTIALCREHNIETVITKVPFEMGKSFPRGRMVNEGFDRLRAHGDNEWILHIDGDMILPDDFMEIVDGADLWWEHFFGAAGRRWKHIVNYACDFTKLPYKKRPGPPKPGLRGVASGYFQLFNARCRWPNYPDHTEHLGDDVIFAQNWPTCHRRPIIGLMLQHASRPGGCTRGRTEKRYKADYESKDVLIPIEAVTVSINFTDYLRQCVGNREYFERWIVVTDRKEEETIELCKSHDIEVVFTKVDYKLGEYFPRGKMINEAFAELRKTDWVMHIDSDIILPDNTSRCLTRKLDPVCFYVPRQRFVPKGTVDGQVWGIMKKSHGRAAGFMQLFHSNKIRPYPEKSPTAAGDDIRFGKFWPPKRRRIIRGLTPVHAGPPGKYWKGRPCHDNDHSSK